MPTISNPPPNRHLPIMELPHFFGLVSVPTCPLCIKKPPVLTPFHRITQIRIDHVNHFCSPTILEDLARASLFYGTLRMNVASHQPTVESTDANFAFMAG